MAQTEIKQIAKLVEQAQTEGWSEGKTLDATEALIDTIRKERIQKVEMLGPVWDFLTDVMVGFEDEEYYSPNRPVPTLKDALEEARSDWYELDPFLDPELPEDEAKEAFFKDVEALINEVGGGALVPDVLKVSKTVSKPKKNLFPDN